MGKIYIVNAQYDLWGLKALMPISVLSFESFSKSFSTMAHLLEALCFWPLLKPGLIDSGVRHRLALIEGQKEMARRAKPCKTTKIRGKKNEKTYE